MNYWKHINREAKRQAKLGDMFERNVGVAKAYEIPQMFEDMVEKVTPGSAVMRAADEMERFNAIAGAIPDARSVDAGRLGFENGSALASGGALDTAGILNQGSFSFEMPGIPERFPRFGMPVEKFTTPSPEIDFRGIEASLSPIIEQHFDSYSGSLREMVVSRVQDDIFPKMHRCLAGSMPLTWSAGGIENRLLTGIGGVENRLFTGISDRIANLPPTSFQAGALDGMFRAFEKARPALLYLDTILGHPLTVEARYVVDEAEDGNEKPMMAFLTETLGLSFTREDRGFFVKAACEYLAKALSLPFTMAWKWTVRPETPEQGRNYLRVTIRKKARRFRDQAHRVSAADRKRFVLLNDEITADLSTEEADGLHVLSAADYTNQAYEAEVDALIQVIRDFENSKNPNYILISNEIISSIESGNIIDPKMIAKLVGAPHIARNFKKAAKTAAEKRGIERVHRSRKR